MTWFNLQVNELSIDYTHCKEINTGKSCADILDEAGNENVHCNCSVEFEIKEGHEITKPVFLYYGLSNFYQNHRRYVRSRDDYQLRGDKPEKLSDFCEPFKCNNKSEQYVPCGAIANSFFQGNVQKIIYLHVPWNQIL